MFSGISIIIASLGFHIRYKVKMEDNYGLGLDNKTAAFLLPIIIFIILVNIFYVRNIYCIYIFVPQSLKILQYRLLLQH